MSALVRWSGECNVACGCFKQESPAICFRTPLASVIWAPQPNPAAPVLKLRFSDKLLEQCTDRPVDTLFFTPELDAGDVALFHQFVMHATQPMTGHFETRRSLEFRVSAAGAVPTFYANHNKPLQRWSWSGGRWSPAK